MLKGWRTTELGWELWWIGPVDTVHSGNIYRSQRTAVHLAHACGAQDVQVIPLADQPVPIDA